MRTYSKPHLRPIKEPNRTNIVVSAGFAAEDAKQWHTNWRRKIHDAVYRKINITLMFAQYLRLARRAALRSAAQIGVKPDQYVLARHKDEGHYEFGNCTFITARQNTLDARKNGRYEKADARNRGETKATRRSCAIVARKNSKSFMVTSPKGVTYHGHNLFQFCKDHGIPQWSMSAVCRGNKDSYKGWTGTYKDPIPWLV